MATSVESSPLEMGRPSVGSGRSPVPSILVPMGAAAVLALGLLSAATDDVSEATVTGWALVDIGVGCGLIAVMTSVFSGQPLRWLGVPAVVFGLTGAGLVLFEPGPAAMDVLSWIWPPAIAALAAWMLWRISSHLRSHGSWLVAPPTALLLVLAIGGGLTTVRGETPHGESANGQLIDIGGRRLYIECTGSGAPVVVLQSGLGESSTYWGGIAGAVDSSTTVCRYDRAGRGRSDEAPARQDGISIAADLHVLLERAGLKGPYLLVGHSSGGPYVRVFADRYPRDVAGMVLLDAQPADAFEALPDYPTFYRYYRVAALLSPTLARVGLFELVFGLPADQSTVPAARSARNEIVSLPTALQQARALATLGDRPLFVVSAGSGQQAGWLAAQDAMTALSTNSEHRVLPVATHTSLIKGGDATGSAQTILDAVATIRTGGANR